MDSGCSTVPVHDPYIGFRETIQALFKTYEQLSRQRFQVGQLVEEIDRLATAATALLQAASLAYIQGALGAPLNPLEADPAEESARAYARAKTAWVDFMIGLEGLGHGLIAEGRIKGAWEIAEALANHGEAERSDFLKRKVTVLEEADDLYSAACSKRSDLVERSLTALEEEDDLFWEYCHDNIVSEIESIVSQYRSLLVEWLHEYPADEAFSSRLYRLLESEVDLAHFFGNSLLEQMTLIDETSGKREVAPDWADLWDSWKRNPDDAPWIGPSDTSNWDEDFSFLSGLGWSGDLEQTSTKIRVIKEARSLLAAYGILPSS